MKQKLNSPILILLVVALVWGCGCPKKYVPKPVPDPLPSFCVPEKIRVALVLGSGGVRGMAHVGVIEELVAAGIPIDLIVGCSAGSIVGSLYADNPDVSNLKRAVWGMRSNSLLDIDIWECRYGLSQGKSMCRIFDKYLTARTFEELKIPLVVVASDLHSGELVPLGSGDLVKAVRASCSIPFVYVPCDYLGRILVDGGVVNPVPVKVAHDLGANIVIAVDLAELLDKTFPTNLFQVATRSAEIAFMWQNEVCTRKADVIIRPKTCGVGAFNDELKALIYEAGKRAAREQIPRIFELVGNLSAEERAGSPNWRLINPCCYKPEIYDTDPYEQESIDSSQNLHKD
jgi:NTE family protein